jgi:hypothetical protein
MNVLVECRLCGSEFEVDVMEISGSWWQRCPVCNAPTPAEDDDEEEDVPDGR